MGGNSKEHNRAQISQSTRNTGVCTLLEWMLCRGCRETLREALNRKNVSVASQVQRVWQCDLFFYFPCCNEAWTDLGKYLQGSEAKQVDGLSELQEKATKNASKLICISCLLLITSKTLVIMMHHVKAFGTRPPFTAPQQHTASLNHQH